MFGYAFFVRLVPSIIPADTKILKHVRLLLQSIVVQMEKNGRLHIKYRPYRYRKRLLDEKTSATRIQTHQRAIWERRRWSERKRAVSKLQERAQLFIVNLRKKELHSSMNEMQLSVSQVKLPHEAV